MPADLKKLIHEKDLILTTVEARGPCLPVHIARAANLSLLFASAYLSELYGESKLRMSHMRVGSSPLYFLSGQEAQLENFIHHLNPKEKEAFELLKQEKILEDTELQPAIRVALRELRDFAVPLRVKLENDTKTFWKYHLLSDDDAKQMLTALLSPLQKKTSREKQQKSEERALPTGEKPAESSTREAAKALAKAKQRKPKADDLTFATKIKEYLTAKDFELLEMLNAKKKECTAKIRLETPLGKQEYYLIIKDKKKITEEDPALAIHRAQGEKMPAMLMSSGTLDKEAQTYLQTWRNLVKFEKVKL